MTMYSQNNYRLPACPVAESRQDKFDFMHSSEVMMNYSDAPDLSSVYCAQHGKYHNFRRKKA